MDEIGPVEKTRAMAIFSCPECPTTVRISNPSDLSDLVILCDCSGNYPVLEHVRGDLEMD